MTQAEYNYVLQVMLDADIKGNKAAIHATIMQKISLQAQQPNDQSKESKGKK